MNFLLGTHEVSWLTRSPVPLFISVNRFRRQKQWPVATVDFGLDSAGFTTLDKYGYWPGTEEGYADETAAIDKRVTRMLWASPRDWMCEAHILAKTGLTVAIHQERTIASYLRLRARRPEIRWIPVLQGWTVDDYLRHADQWAAAGVELEAAPIVGVGSVCRRQGTQIGAAIMRATSRLGIRVHAFGIKTQGLQLFGDRIASADSMAWSLHARKNQIRLAGCPHKTCSNCFHYAMQWRAELLTSLGDRVEPMRQQEMPW